nr:Chain A, W35 [synthetic construct]
CKQRRRYRGSEEECRKYAEELSRRTGCEVEVECET